MGPARFVYERLTPGGLGLELTTLLAAGGVATFAVIALAGPLADGRVLLPGDARAASLARRLGSGMVQDAAIAFTALGSLAVTGVLTLVTAGWAVTRRRAIDGVALVAALAATWLAVGLVRDRVDRPAPVGGLVDAATRSFPSAEAAYALALLACAVVLVRGGSGLATRFAAVTVALVLVLGVAVSRIYLRVAHLSDALGGLALGAAVFSAVGIAALVVAFVRHNPGS
jgi:undecaprenyl-diphosphatase